jgi:hypothetical protein
MSYQKPRSAFVAVVSAVGLFVVAGAQSANAHGRGEPYVHAAKEGGFASCAEFSATLFSHWLFSAPHFGVLWLAALLAVPFAIRRVVRKAGATVDEDSATARALPRVS